MVRLNVAFLAAAGVSSALFVADGPTFADEFDVENFHPVSPGDGELMTVHTTRQVPSKQFAMGFSLGVVNDPLVVVDMDDERVGDVIHSRVGAELTAAYGIGRIEVGAALPFILYQQADAIAALGTDAVENGGMGDARLMGRGWLLPGGEGRIGVGAGLGVTLPTSVNAEFGGEDGPTALPFVTADWRDGAMSFAANMGARVRQKETLGDSMADGALEVGSAFTWGGGAAVKTPELPLWVVGELAGEVGGDTMSENPLEARGGLRADLGGGFSANAGYGRGLVHGYGAPDHRVFGGVIFRPEEETVAERIIVVEEQPRPVAEPPPNPDPDGDGILGDADKCPNEPEDFDGFEDTDGCPETDNDQDGLADGTDSCPNNAEDKDGYQDEDGCPDPDNDLDGIVDLSDKCPNEAEVINGNDDDDGCPDEGKRLVLIGQSKLEIQDKVYFANAKADILPKSDPLLDQIAKTLERNPWIKKVRIEGHTDDRGNDAYNLDLSNRRAASVRDALLKRGVGGERLESIGYGETQPIDSNKTVNGRQHNRRVEFVILDQDTNRPPPDAGTQPVPPAPAPAPNAPESKGGQP
jgi:outer membrane protein OmpA-like peptidoglycan-associated protein